MSTYKVPQDVEAEDKLVFGLTFKQFIFAIVFFVSGFLGFRLAQANLALLGPILPVFLVSGLFAFYRPKDQPAETKVFAYINFFFRKRIRLWSRDGVLEHVHIQAPKNIQAPSYVRTPEQVRSQLRNLAQIVDTRGWSSKQAILAQPHIGQPLPTIQDDRLVSREEIQSLNPVDTTEPEVIDIFDNDTSQLSQNIARMEQRTDDKFRQDIVEKMQTTKAKKTPDGGSKISPAKINDVPEAPETEEERQLAGKLHVEQYPAGMRQTKLYPEDKSPEKIQLEKREKELARSDLPLSVVSEQVNRLHDESEIAFDIEH